MPFLLFLFVLAIQKFIDPIMAISDEPLTANLKLASDVNDRLDWTLAKRTAMSFNGSFIFSPLGLKLTMSFLKEGATGETLNQLTALFRDDLSRVENRKKYENFTSLFKQDDEEKSIANLANWIFLPMYSEVRQRYQAIASTFYNTNLMTVNSQNPVDTAKDINSKVSNFTLGHILNAVNIDDVSGLKILILSTFYMKDSWLHQFKRSATLSDSFYVSPSTQIFLPFMKIVDKFFYSESDKLDAKILRVAYLNSRFGMYLIVPNALSGLPYVLENLSLLPSELRTLQEHYVDVSLPKFEFSYTAYLDDILKEMDLKIIFEDKATIPGIARNPFVLQNIDQRLKVSEIMQISVIEFNEFGSGVSSKTDDSSTNNFENDVDSVKEVIANRPYFFFIEDDITKQILVFGRMAGP